MADTLCGYPDRDEALVTYLYDEMDASARATFDAHLAICARCRDEAQELSHVRDELLNWVISSVVTPHSPEVSQQSPSDGDGHPSTFIGRSSFRTPPPAPGTRHPAPNIEHLSSGTQHRAPGTPWRSWSQIPVWAQVAASLMFLGVSAGLANLDIRYDDHGLSIHTGWSRSSRWSPWSPWSTSGGAASLSPAAPLAQGASAPWRADLTALERQLRGEFRAATSSSGAQATPVSSVDKGRVPMSDAELLRRVHALVDDSEKREQRELALRVAEMENNFRAQRNADLIKIDRALGLVQNDTKTELMRQRSAISYLVGASPRQ